ncbi:MAG: ribonuclease P [Candidatus Micrarchaeota archaeon]|nr:ribonuclease P [Candidatus Micrarchaeota archaeon]
MAKSKRPLVKQIAEERIVTLFGLAEKAAPEDRKLSSKYVKYLRRIAAHYKVGMPKGIRDRICTRCNLVLVPGITSTVRIASSKGYVAYKCDSCGSERHIHY